MRSRTAFSLVCAAALLLLAACDKPSEEPPVSKQNRASRQSSEIEQANQGLPPQALPGGSTTFVGQHPLSALSADALSQAAANLGREGRAQFVVGNSFFTNPWVIANASTAGRDGLGPLFSAAACQDCHVRDGRGHAPGGEGMPTLAVIRIALPDGAPDPVYGSHLQTRAVPGLRAEAKVAVGWKAQIETLPDGSQVELRSPVLRLGDWAYGKPAAGLRSSLRVAPAMTGMGLLEAIPEADLRAQASQQPALGLRGIVNRVESLADGRPALGRFGWKAAKPSVRQQTLDAFINDLGITSSLFPQEVCTEPQRAQGCRDLPSGGAPELEQNIEQAVVFYAQHLAPPARRGYDREAVVAGQKLFAQIGCEGCHRASWRTGAADASPALSNQLIWPYTDLLLHDLGAGLADQLVEGEASGQQWRTAPLWGLGQVKAVGGEAAGYLHDGRARTVSEAILWHGGEAEPARDAWAGLPAAARLQVLAFLNSL
ncbi:MAG: di-heme oxidoredictase family protein [Pseudomonadota bacterium]